MTDRPYTDDDLRAEAAREIKYALDNVDTDGLLEASTYRLTDGTAWEELDEDQWHTALRAVDALVEDAADVSEWAVNLGADDLEPSSHHVDIAEDRPLVRIHFAFHPDMPDDIRQRVIAAVRDETATN
ncbi:hypothetical protein [Streptomyces sp. cg35]|uniref:hypothetical protein n=1 Tax=Streptomyces sp. cg35 TaxID=3421650 RepID=UPI003D185627